MKDRPTTTYEAQIQAIKKLREICTGWAGIETPRKSQVHELTSQRRRSTRVQKLQQPQNAQHPPTVPEHNNPPKPTPQMHIQDQVPALSPRVNLKKETNQEPVGCRTRFQYQTSEQPIARRTQSQLKQALTVTLSQAAHRKFPQKILPLWCTPDMSPDHMAMPALDTDTVITMEYHQLRRHPKYKQIWETSYCNELGHICPGIGTGDNGPKKQRVAGTETFKFISFEDIPQDFSNEVCHTKVVCEVLPHKEDPDITRITIGGNHIIYPGV